jgi:hypothetical protein
MRLVELDGLVFQAPSRLDRILGTAVRPLINYILPRAMLRRLLVGRSPLVDACIRNPGSWECMRLSYDFQESQSRVDSWVQQFGSLPMALRNRKLMVRRTLGEIIRRHGGPASIVGIAAGTGHNIMEGMLEAEGVPSHACMVDLSGDATGYGQELAKQLGLADRTRFVEGNALEIGSLIEESPDIAVAVGIFEYFTDAQVVDLAKAVSQAQAGGGHILVNSIQPAHGSDRFLRTVLGLHLTYRTPDYMLGLLQQAGYSDFEVRSEPVGVYNIVTGRKP